MSFFWRRRKGGKGGISDKGFCVCMYVYVCVILTVLEVDKFDKFDKFAGSGLCCGIN